jgi:hypothetical protein
LQHRFQEVEHELGRVLPLLWQVVAIKDGASEAAPIPPPMRPCRQMTIDFVGPDQGAIIIAPIF